jgi:hypothetical protein
MDLRVERARELYWRSYGTGNRPQPAYSRDLVEMAQLHEDVAKDRLGRDDGRGWIDLYAAVTAFGDAGRVDDVRRLISEFVKESDYRSRIPDCESINP